ncbi:MAG TPA: hypothetical protein PK539_04145 [Candidatus Paceibacterota bacterium]|nr:hypothetical protein [Candidatus Paceibacterota bacterium]
MDAVVLGKLLLRLKAHPDLLVPREGEPQDEFIVRALVLERPFLTREGIGVDRPRDNSGQGCSGWNS